MKDLLVQISTVLTFNLRNVAVVPFYYFVYEVWKVFIFVGHNSRASLPCDLLASKQHAVNSHESLPTSAYLKI